VKVISEICRSKNLAIFSTLDIANVAVSHKLLVCETQRVAKLYIFWRILWIQTVLVINWFLNIGWFNVKSCWNYPHCSYHSRGHCILYVIHWRTFCRYNVQLWCIDGLDSRPRLLGLVRCSAVSVLLCMDLGLWLHLCISGLSTKQSSLLESLAGFKWNSTEQTFCRI